MAPTAASTLQILPKTINMTTVKRFEFFNDLKVIYHLATKGNCGNSHAERLENFYSGQADLYDSFRNRLLIAREQLYAQIDVPENGIWIEMGGGTGSNLEFLGDKIHKLKKVYIVDLCPSLLSIAQNRIAEKGWKNVQTVEQDVLNFKPNEGIADVITFSYSLTMIPNWFAAIDNTHSILKKDGKLAIVDFFVSRKHDANIPNNHSVFTRNFWPFWFSRDGVYLSRDHLPYLLQKFKALTLEEKKSIVPYMLRLKVPNYIFIGQKR